MDKEYLTEENYHNTNKKVKKIGNILTVVGLILLVGDLILTISGFLGFGNQIANGMEMGQYGVNPNSARLQVETSSIVTQLDYLVNNIKVFYRPIYNNNIKILADIINNNNIKDRNKRNEHIRNIQNKIKEDKFKEDNMICPKCGSRLVIKNGKYGTFIGCSNYPNCKYIKNKY